MAHAFRISIDEPLSIFEVMGSDDSSNKKAAIE